MRQSGQCSPGSFAYRVLPVLGWLMIAAGAFCAVAAVMEIQVYRQFATGGRFHYQGYGPGSFMFFLITLSLLVYAGLAAILLALGYGHVRRLAWSVLAAEALVWVWMAVGLPLLAGAAALTLMAKALSSTAGFIILGAAVLLAYPVLPLFLLGLYRRARSDAALKGRHGTAPSLAARGPAAFLAFTAALLFLPILLVSPFPWFGRIVKGAIGATLLLASAAGALISAWALLRGRWWGWWSAAGLFALLIGSATITAASMTVGEMIEALALAPAEAAWFAGLPFLDARPVAIMAIPSAVAAFVLLWARKSKD
ncbi:MAG: hypothetical protein ACM3ZC_01065 [Bacteroidota bacterium]